MEPWMRPLIVSIVTWKPRYILYEKDLSKCSFENNFWLFSGSNQKIWFKNSKFKKIWTWRKSLGWSTRFYLGRWWTRSNRKDHIQRTSFTRSKIRKCSQTSWSSARRTSCYLSPSMYYGSCSYASLRKNRCTSRRCFCWIFSWCFSW